MRYLYRPVAAAFLLFLASIYVTLLVVCALGDALRWVLNMTDRAIDHLSAWGERL